MYCLVFTQLPPRCIYSSPPSVWACDEKNLKRPIDLFSRLLLNLIWAIEFSASLMWKGKTFPPKSNLFSILLLVQEQWNENQGIWNILRPQNRFIFHMDTGFS